MKKIFIRLYNWNTKLWLGKSGYKKGVVANIAWRIACLTAPLYRKLTKITSEEV